MYNVCRHHSTFPRLLATAISHLLTFCGSRDQAVRLAANDVLNKTIKVGGAGLCRVGCCHWCIYAGIAAGSHEQSNRGIISRD